MGYRIINGQAFQVGNVGGLENKSSVNKKVNNEGDFKDILNKAIDKKEGYTLSKHAAERLKAMNFSENDMKNIEKGFKLAEEKGAKNSVMVYKDVAIIASVENKTIITAVDKNRAQSNVFTNVDSVVIL
ncbi:TIGR02530 family flagellar biosynthesis protein [Clostridium vincentii]|uniref:Flagellar operon protein n=1 Tax=Clostridium vincentii TaxID=52704 RepID=A0A2T0BJA2_9CLOT|nr:TIGR02530 family flagellar biosynthesis protein [Clostridium vincentii]PRR83976.1 hypothetical protein CLVI_06300 [Clostridium vincentii]